MSKIDNLVQDIYDLAETKSHPARVPSEQIFKDFGSNMETIMREWLYPKDYSGGTLRMSNIGHPDRKLWFKHRRKEFKGETLKAHTLIKFLYGHLIEEMVLALTKLSGHSVTDEQKQAEVDGIKGSMDCKIDGVLTDVKSASPYGFKKFKDGSLIDDDPFGYIDQIKGYAESEKTTDVGWLVMDKTNGHLTYLKYDMADESQWYWSKLNFFSITERIKNIKRVVKNTTPPKRCYETVADGKSGNMKLAVGCSYCAYKHECWGKDLRTFIYSTGPRYLTEVKFTPSVLEVDADGNKVSE